MHDQSQLFGCSPCTHETEIAETSPLVGGQNYRHAKIKVEGNESATENTLLSVTAADSWKVCI